MSINEIRVFLLWCTLINWGILFLWFLLFTLGGNWMYRFMGRWFPMSRETFTVAMFSGIGLYKIGIILFYLIPLIVLYIIK